MSTRRRDFLKSATLLAAGTAVGGACDTPEARMASGIPDRRGGARTHGFDRATLDALASTVLPAVLGEAGVRAATDAFVRWIEGYTPVAEEMHGYGYADVRHLPADPLPGWRAQLEALDLLAARTKGGSFATRAPDARREVLEAALRRERGGDRLPSPLHAGHVAIALLAHWSASPDAWNRAMGVTVSPGSCRPLAEATREPLPIAPTAPAARGVRA